MQPQLLDKANRRPTEVIARYLEAIYYMRAERETVRSSRLAEWLGVSRPTVTVALRRMLRHNLVRLNTRKEIELTARGEQEAAAIVRRHRVMERWLTDVLGLDWIEADEEAARLEHSVSEVVEERVWETLGKPSSCPHGNPIPGYAEMRADERRLAELEAGETVRVHRISEVAEREAPALLRYLLDRRIVPGAKLRVLEADEVGHTLRLDVGGKEVTLSSDTATKVWAVPS
ncbi:MAG TPA: metal-dependent transcriptional regulator [Candidatus Dormibacteraeota bacterium]